MAAPPSISTSSTSTSVLPPSPMMATTLNARTPPAASSRPVAEPSADAAAVPSTRTATTQVAATVTSPTAGEADSAAAAVAAAAPHVATTMDVATTAVAIPRTPQVAAQEESAAATAAWRETQVQWVEACKDWELETMHSILRRSSPSQVALLLDTVVTDKGGYVALHVACLMGDLQAVVALCQEFGADVEKRTTRGQTCLMLCCLRGFTSVAKYLLLFGRADVHAVTADGLTCLDLACAEGRLDMVQVLIEDGHFNVRTPRAHRGLPALHTACVNGSIDIVKCLLDAGADANETTENGFTALMVACFKGQIECVVLLLDAGAKTDVQVEGASLFAAVVGCHQLAIARMLLSRGVVNVEAERADAVDALVHACEEDDEELLAFLAQDLGAEVPELIWHRYTESNNGKVLGMLRRVSGTGGASE